MASMCFLALSTTDHELVEGRFLALNKPQTPLRKTTNTFPLEWKKLFAQLMH